MSLRTITPIEAKRLLDRSLVAVNNRFARVKRLQTTSRVKALLDELEVHLETTTTSLFQIIAREAEIHSVDLEASHRIAAEALRHYGETEARALIQRECSGWSVPNHVRTMAQNEERLIVERLETLIALHVAGFYRAERPTPVTSYTINQSGSGNSLIASQGSPGASITPTVAIDAKAVNEAARVVSDVLPRSGLDDDDKEAIAELVAQAVAQAEKPKPNRKIIASALDGLHKITSIAGTAVRPEFVSAVGRLVQLLT